MKLIIGLLCFAALLPAQMKSDEIRAIAQRAYIYAYPMVLMEETRAGAGLNRLNHAQAYPEPESRQVIRPNADTLYSSSWIDLSTEPVVIKVPDSGGRYYLMQFLDDWTETFSVPGKRTTGTGEQWMILVGPGWKGVLPEKTVRIDAPTNIVWLIGRTQTNGLADYENVHAFQREMRMMPLSAYPDGAAPARPAPVAGQPASPPPVRVRAMDARTFFTRFAEALKANPPHSSDQEMLKELARIGIVPGQSFDFSRLDLTAQKALEEGARAASDQLERSGGLKPSTGPTSWSAVNSAIGRYGLNYAARAATARAGLGALPPEDAVYLNSRADSAGQPLSGTRRYRIHFEKQQLPPVRAFWSLTAYGEEGYFIPNSVRRYTIGDRDPLKVNADGSLDLYVQASSPGADRESNWLPSGEGPFNFLFRLYWPEGLVGSGQWVPPPVVRID